MSFDEDNWKAYREANRRFAEAVFEEICESVWDGEDVLVWVQDYHLSARSRLSHDGRDADVLEPQCYCRPCSGS